MWSDIKDWPKTYFAFEGRFNRAKYWLHSVLALGVTMFLQLIAMYMFPIPDEIIMVFKSETLQKVIMGIIGAAPAVTFVYISTAISVKRLHDRDKSGWWGLFYLGLPSLILFAIVMAADANGHVTGWPAALTIPYFILLIVTFVELACLKGTTGPNRFGPDPLPVQPVVKPPSTASAAPASGG
jgi:uncharacterized membrane protein YhaH (DUF805 family)